MTVLAGCRVPGAGLCALVAFAGAGAGVGDPNAYDGWAWTALVASLVGAAGPVALAVVTHRSRPSSGSALVTFIVAADLVVFGALVGVGVLAGRPRTVASATAAPVVGYRDEPQCQPGRGTRSAASSN